MVSRVGLRAIAILEAAKGVLVLAVSIGITRSVARGDAARIAEEIVSHYHLDPERHMTSIFLRLAHHTSDTGLQFYAATAALYALIRFAEAWGLWWGRAWAEWVGLIGAAIYIPVEIHEIIRRPRSLLFILLALNLLLVAYLLAALKNRPQPSSAVDVTE